MLRKTYHHVLLKWALSLSPLFAAEQQMGIDPKGTSHSMVQVDNSMSGAYSFAAKNIDSNDPALQNEGYETLVMIATTPTQERAFWAACDLVESHDPTLQNKGYEALVGIATNPTHNDAYSAARKLVKESGNPTLQNKGYEAMVGIAMVGIVTNPTQERFLWAARKLMLSPDPQWHGPLREIVTGICNTPTVEDAMKKKYIDCLRESHDPEDQQLGRALKQQYFPVQLREATLKAMDKLNLKAFEAAVPRPLKDLSHVPMDLVGGFSTILARMNVTDPNDPFYIHVGAVDETYKTTPDEKNPEKMKEIHLKFTGFLKTLLGQPLEGGEVGGWQMYEDKKPAMVNTLKHVLMALQQAMDKGATSEAMYTMGVILKGLLYCPTGQNEAIESVVRSVLHKQEGQVNALEETMKPIIHGAVVKVFLNAFHHQGGVHGLSRARMVLEDLVGNTLKFQEKISPPSEEDEAEIKNMFYQTLTPQFLVDEVKRSVRTAEDEETLKGLEVALKQAMKENNEPEVMSLKRRLRILKEEKPLRVGDLYQWVCNHNKTKGSNAIDDIELIKVYGFLDRPEDLIDELPEALLFKITEDGLRLFLKELGYLK